MVYFVNNSFAPIALLETARVFERSYRVLEAARLNPSAVQIDIPCTPIPTAVQSLLDSQCALLIAQSGRKLKQAIDGRSPDLPALIDELSGRIFFPGSSEHLDLARDS
jgi:hypothetical protein